jgi:hypothetical protein
MWCERVACLMGGENRPYLTLGTNGLSIPEVLKIAQEHVNKAHVTLYEHSDEADRTQTQICHPCRVDGKYFSVRRPMTPGMPHTDPVMAIHLNEEHGYTIPLQNQEG